MLTDLPSKSIVNEDVEPKVLQLFWKISLYTDTYKLQRDKHYLHYQKTALDFATVVKDWFYEGFMIV